MAVESGKQYEIDMCSGSVLRKMLAFALPLMCSSILQLLFNAADIVVVGHFAGDNALAAVGSNTSLINLMTNLFIGLSIGTNVLAARCQGAQDREGLRRTVHTSMLLSLLSGLLLTVVGMLGAKQILVWMQTPPEVLDLAARYLRIYFLGMTAMMIYNFGSALLRAVGDTRRPLYFLLTAGVINVGLNLLFVVVFHWGVAGVAAATAISQCVSAALIVICLMRESSGIHLVPDALQIHGKQLRLILQIGLPAGFQGVLFALSNVVIQSSVNGFGATVMAGNSAAANLEGFVYVAMNAFYQATISFTSQNLGAGNYKRIRRIVLVGQGCVIVVGLLLGNLVYFCGQPLLHIYSGSDEVIKAGIIRLGIISTTYALCGMMDVMVGALRGIGYSVLPMVVSLIGACGLRLVWIATLFQVERFHTIRMLYLTYPISWVLTFVAHLFCFFWAFRRVKRKLGT